jgi:hypothetical protein
MSMRLLSVCAKSNRPLPQFSPDDVVDYQVMEALVLRAEYEEGESEDESVKREFRKSAHHDQDFLQRARAAEAG